jgi:NAD-dependent dihydropyrimidine dehydrogenase PreA subunit
MLEETLDLYRELQQHLDKFAVGFPTTKSGVEIRILKHLFTPEEAKLAARLSDKFQSINSIFEEVKGLVSSIEDLKTRLDKMVSKGAIHYKLVDGERYYANAYLALGIAEYQVNKLTKEYMKDFSDYALEAFAKEIFSTGIYQFRTVPIEKSITPELYIPSYEEVKTIIENSEGPVALINCICRQGHGLRGEPCKVTSRQETCLGFSNYAQIFIDEGWGRAITKKEALDIARKNEKDGLVFQAGNSKKPLFICSCCGCCCVILNNLNILPRPAQFISTNYYAQVNSELCIGCETCIERCNMNAIKLAKEKAKINLKRCIGCGNCVATCLQEAMKLIKKDELDVPPETPEELYENILAKKIEMRAKK